MSKLGFTKKASVPWGDILQTRSCHVPCPTTPPTVAASSSNASQIRGQVDETLEVDTGIRIGGQKMKLTVEDKSAAVGKFQRFKDFIIGKSVQDAMKKIGVCNDN